MRSILLYMTVVVMALSLTACRNNVQGDPDESQSVMQTLSTETTATSADEENSAVPPSAHTDAEFYGSFLTMETTGNHSELEDSYFEVLTDYSQIEDYYDSGSRYYIYGKKFTLAMASFNDEFMADHDILILVLKEPSTYITHDIASITESDGKTVFEISRLIIENATMSDTYYHLVFIGNKGTFDDIKELDFTVDIAQTVTKEKYAANDAEIYLYSYPEFWPFVYQTTALSTPTTEIDTIKTYDQLISYYEQHKDDYELDSFKKHIGSLYDESMFNDYILLMVLMPYDNNKETPEIDRLFVYNSEIYISIGNSSDAVISSTTSSCLLVTAVSKSDLQGVDLGVFNISFE